MFGFQPIAFSKPAGNSAPPCVTLTWKSAQPAYMAMADMPYSGTLTDLLQTGTATLWTVGGLPPGITYNSSTGALSGTAPSSASGGYMVFVDAYNVCTGTISTTISFQVV